eukprot:scaffold2799_cov159-Ochromonas_danica.AAC.11
MEVRDDGKFLASYVNEPFPLMRPSPPQSARGHRKIRPGQQRSPNSKSPHHFSSSNEVYDEMKSLVPSTDEEYCQHPSFSIGEDSNDDCGEEDEGLEVDSDCDSIVAVLGETLVIESETGGKLFSAVLPLPALPPISTPPIISKTDRLKSISSSSSSASSSSIIDSPRLLLHPPLPPLSPEQPVKMRPRPSLPSSYSPRSPASPSPTSQRKRSSSIQRAPLLPISPSSPRTPRVCEEIVQNFI